MQWSQTLKQQNRTSAASNFSWGVWSGTHSVQQVFVSNCNVEATKSKWGISWVLRQWWALSALSDGNSSRLRTSSLWLSEDKLLNVECGKRLNHGWEPQLCNETEASQEWKLLPQCFGRSLHTDTWTNTHSAFQQMQQAHHPTCAPCYAPSATPAC